MKNHVAIVLTCGMLCAAMMCLNVAAQTTANVQIDLPRGEFFYQGTSVTVTADAIVDIGNTPETITATFDSLTCVLDNTTIFSAPSYQVNVVSQTSTFYNNKFALTAPAAGTYQIACTTSGQLSGGVSGPFSGSGTATLTVTACSGDSNYTELPSSANGLWEDSTWDLYADMSPPNASKPNPQSIGTATGTGITGNLAVSTYAFDCDYAANNDIAEQYATIADLPQSLGPNGEIYFYFEVTNYDYSNSVLCDICDANPNGYYPVVRGSSTKQFGPFPASCGSTQ